MGSLRVLFGGEKIRVFGRAGNPLTQHTIGGASQKGAFHITQMSVPYQWFALLVIFFSLTACESDLEKLQRLDDERSIACLNAEIDQRVFMQERHPSELSKENSMKPPTPVAESLGRVWSASKAECELLSRKYQSVGR